LLSPSPNRRAVVNPIRHLYLVSKPTTCQRHSPPVAAEATSRPPNSRRAVSRAATTISRVASAGMRSLSVGRSGEIASSVERSIRLPLVMRNFLPHTLTSVSVPAGSDARRGTTSVICCHLFCAARSNQRVRVRRQLPTQRVHTIRYICGGRLGTKAWVNSAWPVRRAPR